MSIDDQDPEDFEFETFPADLLVEVYLTQTERLLSEGFSLHDVVAAITLAAADVGARLRTEH